jgi:diguanylate cyclase (GGDEF)-like protein/putative nucleotidyltransferase with HDIG domain
MDIQNVALKLIVNIIPIISAIYIIVGIRLFTHKIGNKLNYFSFFMFASALYSFGYFLELNCTSFDTLLIVRNFEFLGSVFVPTFGILFIAEITRNKVTRKAIACLCLISVSLWLVFITNPLHSLIYKNVELNIIGGLGVVHTIKGPAFYSMMIYYAMLLIYSSIVLMKAYKKSKKNNRKKSYLFLLVSLQVPWLTILFIVLGFDTFIDPVPVTIITICILFGINEIQNDMFELQVNRWNSTFADIGEPAFLVDRSGQIVCSNNNANILFAKAEKSPESIIAYLDEYEAANKPVFFIVNDEAKWYTIKKNDFDTRREFTNYLFINITDRKQAEDALKESQNRLIAAQQMAHVGNWEIDIETKKIWASVEAFNIYGIEMISPILPLEFVQKCVFPEYRELLDKALVNLIAKNEKYNVEYKMKKANNQDERFIHSKALLVVDENGNARKVVGTIQDITERKNREEEISYLSYHDQLTGLYNRRFYEEELKRLDTERNLPLTIAMGDVNGLKLINDSFGHYMGDELLKKVAQVIKTGCRADDIIARLGGDEFVMILPKTSTIETEKMILRIKELLQVEKIGALDISVSFGFETKIKKDDSIDEIIKNTEDHMYRHKLYEGLSIRSKTIDLIMNTLYEKNNREMLHSKRVSALCEAIAIKLGMDKDDINQIRLAGLMHDIGKIGIDEKILNKPDKLNNEEWKEIQRHSEIGYRILSSVNEFSEIADYVLEHQERWDGNGYPRKLKGEEISLQARIIAVADAYDAMTTQRTYGNTLSEEEAIIEINKCSGIQFDPNIVKVFNEKVLNQAESA